MNQNQLLVLYGDQPLKMGYEIMSAAKVEDLLDKSMRIAIKPNLVVAKPSHSGATTTPQLVEGVIQYLKDHGFHQITIMEGSWIGDSTQRAYKVCGYESLSSKYRIPLIDLKKDRVQTVSYMGEKMEICRSALEADFLINMPVLKAHCQTSLTCALKNLKGCIPDKEKRRFHALGLHKPIALLNHFLKAHLIVVDGLMGDLTFEEGGTPVEMNRVILGRDPVLVDSYAAQLLGYSIEEIPYISLAEKLGVGTSTITETTAIEINKAEAPSKKITPSRRVAHLARYIEEDQACSACYGSLIHALHRLDENGELRGWKQRIHIGQGYRGKSGPGVGIGSCTSGFACHLKGCPPKASAIKEFIQDTMK